MDRRDSHSELQAAGTLAIRSSAGSLFPGLFPVFVPSTWGRGAVHILAHDRVHLIDANVRQVLHCVHMWGVGAGELVKSMRRPCSSAEAQRGIKE